MDNITKKISKILDSDPVLKQALQRNIINKRALSIYIIKEHNLNYEVNAVISALRRYEIDNEKIVDYKNAIDVISSGVLSSKNGIVSITLKKDSLSEKFLSKIFEIVEIEKNQSLRIVQANEAIKIIIDKNNLERLKKLIPQNRIIRVDENLAEIIIHLDKRTWSTPGVAAILTTELSLNNINILEIISCMPEIIIFFKEEDIMNAYSVIYKIRNNKK